MKIAPASSEFQTEEAIPLSDTLVPIVTIKTKLTEYLGDPYSECVNEDGGSSTILDTLKPKFVAYNER